MRAVRVASLVALALAVLGAAAAVAATVSAPGSVPVGGHLTVHARGLVRGRYGLFLVKTAFQAPPGGESLDCFGRIGPLRTLSGSATLSGRLPRRLTCRFGTGEVTRRIAVTPGGYHLLLASPSGPGAFDGTKSFVRRRIQVTAAG